MLRKALISLMLSAGAALLVGVMISPSAYAAGDSTPKVGPKVGKPLGAAIEALNKTRNFDECIAKAKEADAVPDKSPYEQSQIYEVLAVCYLNNKDFPNAAAYFEKGYESGQLPADKVNDRLKLLAQLFYQTRDLPKAAGYGSQWLKATGASDVTMFTLVGQAYYLNKNCDEATGYLSSAVKAAVAAGEKPDENSLLILQQCYAQKKDVANVNETLIGLIRYYPKKDYWDKVLNNLLSQASSDSIATLNVFRLMSQAGAMDTVDEYLEMSSLAVRQGLPGEAQQVLKRGFASGTLNAGNKERTQDVADKANQQATQDKKTLAQQEKTAQSSRDGQVDVGLGEGYLSYDQYPEAVAAIQRGIQKGGVKDVDAAYLSLGRAYFALKNGAEARKAFDQVKGKQLGQMAELWSILAAQN